MLSGAKHLEFYLQAMVQKRSEILRVAENDTRRLLILFQILRRSPGQCQIRSKYVHTNLIARDWKRLVRFYFEVFGCEPEGPERDMSGAWLDELTSLRDAHFTGVHLRLPGYGDDGPTLEIFSYDRLIESELPEANRCGFGHVAFAVDDVDEALEAVIAAGGGAVGNIETTKAEGVGTLRVVYSRDPEGNIVELQKWS